MNQSILGWSLKDCEEGAKDSESQRKSKLTRAEDRSWVKYSYGYNAKINHENVFWGFWT